jgi:hypothetical protein
MSVHARSFRSSSWLLVALVAIAVATFVRDPKALQLAVRRALLQTNWTGTCHRDEAAVALNCADAHQFLTDVMPVKGFHVLCLETTAADMCVNGQLVRLVGG